MQKCVCLHKTTFIIFDLFNIFYTDINECQQSPVCHSMATCSNIRGSFSCQCKKGYTGDGKINCTGMVHFPLSKAFDQKWGRISWRAKTSLKLASMRLIWSKRSCFPQTSTSVNNLLRSVILWPTAQTLTALLNVNAKKVSPEMVKRIAQVKYVQLFT